MTFSTRAGILPELAQNWLRLVAGVLTVVALSGVAHAGSSREQHAPQAAPEETLTSDLLVFPVPDRSLLIVRAVEHPGELRAGRILPTEDPLQRAVHEQLRNPFFNSLVLLTQCARNLAGVGDQPNVLYLSEDRGGFARQGLVLLSDEGEHPLPDLHYVDLVLDPARLAAGDLDIFSHELGHVMMRTLWPSLGNGADVRLTPKMHLSMGITDPVTALFEGFGIHFERLTQERIPLYRELFEKKLRRADNAATWWHSTVDTELRLNAALQNRYVFRRLLPLGIDHEALDVEQRILLAHASPLFDPTQLRNAQEILASEGVLATLFYRMAHSDELGASYEAPTFYRPFLARPIPSGGRAEEIFTPFENVMLKHFSVWHAMEAGASSKRPLLIRYVETWGDAFPADRETLLRIFVGTTVGRTVDQRLGERFLEMTRCGLLGDYACYTESRTSYERSVDELVRKVLDEELALDRNVGPELWIEIPGVSVRRALWNPERRRPLWIDLNTCNLQELLALPGMDTARASRILTLRDRVGHFRSRDHARSLGVEVPAD